MKNIDSFSDKKILLVTSWIYPHVGGVSSHISLLASKFGIRDDEVVSFDDIVDYSKRGIRRFRFLSEKQIRTTIGVDTISMYARNLQHLLRRTNADIVHCHDAMAAWAAWIARKKDGASYKIVTTVHGPFSRHMVEEGASENSPDVRKVSACERFIWKRCDAIIAVDSTQAKIVREQGGIPEKISIIPNSVDTERLNVMARNLPLQRREKRQWIFVPRRFTPKNGVQYAIRALALMKKKPRLLLAGHGLEQTKMESLVRELSLEQDVVFLGSLPHSVMIPLLYESDIVALPSVPVHGIEEATSIAALEAMALGKAVVASAVGGLKELFTNNVNALLVEHSNPQQLAEAFDRLLKNPMLRRKFGLAARRAMEKQFSDDAWFRRIHEVYAKVLR